MVPALARAACIDVGSNTTRLLVGERGGDGDVAAVAERRTFTGLGGAGPVLGSERIAAVCAVVEEQVALARANGVAADGVRVVGTAAVRRAGDRAALCAAVRAAAGVTVEVLDADEEARLAFRGATRPGADGSHEPVAVLDVGGGSCQLAVGRAGAREVEWSASVALGSATLAAEWAPVDPPDAGALAAARSRAAAALAALRLPPGTAEAVAVGGAATSLRQLVGDRLDAAALERGLARVTAAPAAETARALGLAVERVRLLPAGIVLLAAASERLALPLGIACGGLREGVVGELLDGAPAQT